MGLELTPFMFLIFTHTLWLEEDSEIDLIKLYQDSCFLVRINVRAAARHFLNAMRSGKAFVDLNFLNALLRFWIATAISLHHHGTLFVRYRGVDFGIDASAALNIALVSTVMLSVTLNEG